MRTSLPAAWLACLALIGSPSAAETLTIACGSVGMEVALCRAGTERWGARTGHRVEVVTAPESSTERLTLYRTLLESGAPDVDLFQIDVTWPGLLGRHFAALGRAAGRTAGEHFPGMVEALTVEGRLVAIPWAADAGLLYYRKDLLAAHDAGVPRTWAELEATARRIQAAERARGRSGFWGFVWQGRAYEGLTCNALEWIASHGGGTILGPGGEVTVANESAASALDRAAAWIGEITPGGVLNFQEEDARHLFQAGDALFMRNWPYAWALLQGGQSPVQGRIGITVLPRAGGGRHAATIGGWALAVSRYSRHPGLATDLALFLSGREEQKRRAVLGSNPPSRRDLYADAEVLAAVPFFGELYAAVSEAAVQRPSARAGDRYGELSKAFWGAAHRVLSGEVPGARAVHDLEQALEAILGE